MLKIIEFDLYKKNNRRNLFIYKSEEFNNNSKPFLFIVHDAQNFYDKKYASYNMSWDIVSTLNKLKINNYLVVGLESLPFLKRILELSPLEIRQEIQDKLPNLRKKVFGKKYLKALRKNLIPWITNEFNLKEYKKIMIGSSMGGLITTYSAIKDYDFYDGFIAFSNALSVNSPYIYKFINKNKKIGNYYTYMGGKESSENIIENSDYNSDYKFIVNYLSNNYKKEKFASKFNPSGSHNELAWKNELEEALKWIIKRSKNEEN